MSTWPGGPAQRRVRRGLVAGQRDDLVGAEGAQCVEPLRIAPGADHTPGAEPPGHLDRHRSGVPGGAEHQDALAGPQRHAAP